MKKTLKTFGLFEKKSLALLSCILLLTSCGNIKDQLGVTKDAPDEFAVIKRAPLEMPPSLVLPPPQPGIPRPQEKTPEIAAKQALFGTESAESFSTTASSAENVLLNNAGGSAADPNIRSVVEEEAIEEEKKNRTVAQKLLGIGGKKTETPAEVVDAPAEAKRIQDNIKSGKSVTEGNTPSVQR